MGRINDSQGLVGALSPPSPVAPHPGVVPGPVGQFAHAPSVFSAGCYQGCVAVSGARSYVGFYVRGAHLFVETATSAAHHWARLAGLASARWPIRVLCTMFWLGLAIPRCACGVPFYLRLRRES